MSRSIALLGKALEEPRLVGAHGPRRRSTFRRARTISCTSRGARSRRSRAPFDAHLAWGASGFAFSLTDAKGRDHAVHETMAFAGKLGAPKRVGEMLGELAHELIMNALYDAPVDELGKPRFAHDRKAEIALDARGRGGLSLRLRRRAHRRRDHRSLRAARAQARVRRPGARAQGRARWTPPAAAPGLGMLVSYRSTTALFYDVEPRLRTRVTGLFDLDLEPARVPSAAEDDPLPRGNMMPTGTTDPGQKPKLRLDKTSDGGITLLKLAGTIDEQFEGKKIAVRHQGRHA